MQLAELGEDHPIDCIGRAILDGYKWKCLRCNTDVDMTIRKCKCIISPSPWDLVKINEVAQRVQTHEKI